ncbi:hypothetical protein ABIF07_000183 [Bradyrhizobium elkanii]|nr:hypothetical protein [Bradyrhizobium elkanii]
MVDVPATRRVDPETRRALQLDTLAAILPMDRRDRVAQLLTDDDVETEAGYLMPRPPHLRSYFF